MKKYYFLLIIFLGLVIRLLLVGNTGFIADISFWKSWGLAALDHGIVWTAHNTNINYPPGFIYVLWLMGKLYSFLGDPHDYYTFWRENNFGFLLVCKSIAVSSDVIIAWLIYWFFSNNIMQVIAKHGKIFADRILSERKGSLMEGRRLRLERVADQENFVSERLPLLLSAVFFLNPIVILDSALWGQVESFGILFTLVAIILIFKKRPVLASMIFTVGALMKLQNIIYIPIFFLFIFRSFDLKTLLKSLAAATMAFFLVTLPFIFANDMKQVLYLLTLNSDYFPWLSLNAHNLWWIVAKAAGMQMSDKITVLGILNAKTTGLILFSGCYLLSCILVYRKPNPRNFFLSLTFAIFAFFLFTTESHERYSYPVIVFLLFMYPFLENKNIKVIAKHGKQLTLPYFWILYILLTIAIFFNIHTGLVYNYPQNGWQLLTFISSRPLTIVNSYFLVILFFMLLPFIFSQISFSFFWLVTGFVALAFLALNSGYILTSKVSLTSFKPISIKQDYGILQVNKSVNSFSGWKSWNRLSNNYFYYRQGFGTHANSTLIFDLNGLFKTFETDAGIDTEAPTTASVIFKVIGDDKVLYTSQKMGRFDFPQHLKVDVSGVKFLSLVVTDAGDGINGDHADWLNPELYK